MRKGKKCETRECPLWEKGIEVKYIGQEGNNVAYCGESPGRVEEIKGLPFVGDSGDLLRDCSKEAGLPIVLGDVALLNSARCKINKDALNDKVIKQVLECCRPKLEAALHAIKPKLIIGLGDIALQQLLRKKGITKHRADGPVFSQEFGCYVLPTFHPAYVLRQMGKRPVLVQDIKLAVSLIENDFKVATVDKADFDYQEMQSLANWRKSPPTDVGLDTETNGVDWKNPNFVLVSYSVSGSDNTGFQIRLFKECPVKDAEFTITVQRILENKKKLEEVEIGVQKDSNFTNKVKDLKWLLENDAIRKFMMNGNFERHGFRWLFGTYLKTAVPEIKRYAMDIQAGANLLDENIFVKPSLDQIQMAWTQRRDNYKALFASNRSDILGAPNDRLIFYACSDADVTRQVGLNMLKEFRKKDNRDLACYFVRFTMPALAVLSDMEEYGVGIDLEQFPKTMEEVAGRKEQLQSDAEKLMPVSIRNEHVKKGLQLTRRDLVSDLLFTSKGLGLSPHKKTKEGYSTDKETLKTILERPFVPETAKELIPILQKFNELQTIHSRYLKGMLVHIVDGRIHSSFSLATTVTGRTGSSRPNMQNNPKRSEEAKMIRRLFKARPGYIFIAGDIAQCLVPETEMITIDGRRSLAQVIEDRIPVLSVDENWILSFQNVVHGWSTGRKEVLKITFDDGSSEICSKTHRFKSWHGSWSYAEDLIIGDKLAHVSEHTSDKGYPEWSISRKGSLKDGGVARFRKHVLVGDLLSGGKVPIGYEVHHKDFSKSNWVRENIEVKTKLSHRKLHAAGVKNPNFGNRKGAIKICPICLTRFYRPTSRGHEETCSKSCSNKLFPRWATLPRNHKVVSIEKIGKRETFQIEVANNHTYILANGLISRNSELRWCAHVSNDKEMIRAFNAGEDPHVNTAKDMVKRSWEKLSDADKKIFRQRAKPVNFGMIYLMSPRGLVSYAKLEYGVDMTVDEAEDYITAFFRKYPGVSRYHNKTIEFCREFGYVDSPLGRRRRLPGINSKDKALKAEAERMAVNHPIQEPSSSTVLLAAWKIKQMGLDPGKINPALFVHDELVYEVKDNGKEVSDFVKILKDALDNPPLSLFDVKLKVPLESEITAGYNLAELKTIAS